MRSIDRSTSAQAHTPQLEFERLYLATNGVGLIDHALSLDWILSLMLEYVQTHGEDVALWISEDGGTPRLIGYVKALPNGCALSKII